VKTKLILAVTLLALTALLPWMLRGQMARADALSPNEIVTTVRGMGLNPLTQPERRGSYYVLHAADAYGVEMRVVADAKLGDIVSIAPARALANAYAMSYGAGPRIIHVPQNYESRVSARSDEPTRTRGRIEEPDHARVEEPRTDAAPDTGAEPYDNSAADPYGRPGEVDSPVASRGPVRPLQPWEQHRRPFNAAPPPPPHQAMRDERRSSADGPTPIKPTPRFDQHDPQVAATIPPAESETPAVDETPRRAVRRIDIPRTAPRD
jgi:hypothetical protein